MREQRVRIGSCMSKWQKINVGVLQDTVLGPTFFGHDYRFDDTLIISIATESIEPNCVTHLQDLVDYVFTWAADSDMKLNISKCNEMLIDFTKDKRFFNP